MDTTTITVDIIRETDAAILVTDSNTQTWLPKSQIEYDTGAGEGDADVEIELPVWLAEKAGLA
ncbi:MAG: hypothetical protein LBR94_09985 [Desulfovibrio sp.]|jgi:hypothetical protein|nr:hypothetical protein [Desulfovibrio sp.]